MDARFAAAWRFLTVVPLPFSRAGGDELDCLRRSPPLFPLVGLALGCIAALVCLVLSFLFPHPVLAVLSVALLTALSGGLHLDGLADSADALSSPVHDREKALAIMKDSRIGTHGALALAVVLMLKFSCFLSIPPCWLPLILLVAPVCGRAAMLFPMVMLPYARERGLGGLFDIKDKGKLLFYACLWTGVSLAVLFGLRGGALGFVLWLVLTLGWVLYLRRRLGGATGDSYGAACELGETAACLTAAMLLCDV